VFLGLIRYVVFYYVIPIMLQVWIPFFVTENNMTDCEMSDLCGGEYEDESLLGYSAM
jgi:hypothetical protein